jgi:hypothetical protein
MVECYGVGESELVVGMGAAQNGRVNGETLSRVGNERRGWK